MEQEFDVEIKEVLSRVQKVKAESLDDAINKAMDMYYAEQIVLGAEDMKGVHEMNIKKSSERQYAQDKGSVKFYTFALPGESEPRKCTFHEMIRLIKERCPNGKMKEILLA